MTKCNVTFLKAVADENRIKMMDLLKQGPMCVSEVCKHFAMKQPSVSHHLTILKTAGIVSAEKFGKEVRYKLNDKYVCSCCENILTRYSEDGEVIIDE